MEYIAHLKRWRGSEKSRCSITAITDTLEVLTSYWNHIDDMYSDIKQGDSETTDQLDQHIKNIVERCQYATKAEVMVHCPELLFYAMKHFEVKNGYV